MVKLNPVSTFLIAVILNRVHLLMPHLFSIIPWFHLNSPRIELKPVH